jgi:hypothetical protein
MEVLAVLRELRRARIAVAIGAVLALAIIVHSARGGDSRSGLAWTRVVLDTPKSELVNPAPAGADTLEWRAGVLAEMLLTDPLRAQIARDAGITPDTLATIDPDIGEPTVAASMPQRGADAANVVSEPNVLTVRTQALPIISIEAAAPTRAAAMRVADAAVRALETQATPDPTPTLQGLLIERAAPTRGKEVVSHHGPLMGIAMAIFFFAFWCSCVALGSALKRSTFVRGRTGGAPGRKIPALSAVEFANSEREGLRMTHDLSAMSREERR